MIEQLLSGFNAIRVESEHPDYMNATRIIRWHEPEELHNHFHSWVEMVSSSLRAADLLVEAGNWEKAKDEIPFYKAEFSFAVHAEPMTAILLGILGRLDKADSFINRERLNQLRALQSSRFDFAKLIQLCDELNASFANDCFFAVAALTRTILNHVPPVFGFDEFLEFCNSYKGQRDAKSFKAAMTHLQESSRKIADLHLHTRIEKHVVLPNPNQVNFSSDLDLLLSEIVTVTKLNN